MESKPDRIIIASDVHKRDGIGIEVYRDNKLVLEIFRDDTDRTRTVSIFQDNVSLDLMEESIQTFKKEIPWAFIED